MQQIRNACNILVKKSERTDYLKDLISNGRDSKGSGHDTKSKLSSRYCKTTQKLSWDSWCLSPLECEENILTTEP